MRNESLTGKVTPKLIDEITTQLDRMNQLQLSNIGPRSGLPIGDYQGMVLLARDEHVNPFVTFLSIPIPLTSEDALKMRNLWLEHEVKLGVNGTGPGSFLASAIDVLIAEIGKQLAVENLSNLLGCYFVNDLSKQGTPLKAQVVHNRTCVDQCTLESHFVIETLDSTILRFRDVVAHRIRPGVK